MKQFEIDYDIKRIFEKNERKKHPLWIKRRKVRIILLLMPVLIAIISYFLLDTFDEVFLRVTTAICMGIFSIALPGIYIPCLIYSVLQEFRNKENENIFISDESIRYIFHRNKYEHKYMQEFKMEFKDIKSIIYNKYHERVEVYGILQDIWYSDYFKKEIGNSENFYGVRAKIRFHLYFNDNKEILKMIEERSPVEIQVVNVPAYDE